MPRSGHFSYSVHPAEGESLPAVILIHGAGGRGDQWPYQMRRLQGRRVFALDLPGHGHSGGNPQPRIEGYTNELLAWIELMDLKRSALVGHSMGAAIALTAALLAPDKVQSLVLIGAASSFPANPILLEKLSVPAWHEQAVKMIVTWSFAKKASNRLRQLYSADLLANAPGVLLADFRACSEFAIDEQLKTISRPTLVLSGEEDVMVPLGRSRLLAERLMRGSLKTIPGCGHMLHLEDPPAVANAILRFLDLQARYH
ncbi:MAG: alpha/beta fold hydrolase [Anaerolineales bacterium]